MRSTFGNTRKVLVIHADVMLWHRCGIKERLRGSGMKRQDQTVADHGVKSNRRRFWRQRHSLACLFMCLGGSSLTGVDVTEHALKCLLRLFLCSLHEKQR